LQDDDDQICFSFWVDCELICVQKGGDLVVANLGDSRAVLGTMAEDGRLEAVQLTTDLKPDLPCKTTSGNIEQRK